MRALLLLSRLIDGLNNAVGKVAYWLVLVASVISATNAFMRYGFNLSSNAWLEVQWYLFSGVFLLCAGYAYLHNAHVRIDLIAGRFSARTQAWIDVFGIIFMMMPALIVILWFGWQAFYISYDTGEMSSNAGGLIRWPVKMLVPVGFALLILQGISELIKRIAFLAGRYDWSPHSGHTNDAPASAGGQ